jgi:hypothetical protein
MAGEGADDNADYATGVLAVALETSVAATLHLLNPSIKRSDGVNRRAWPQREKR